MIAFAFLVIETSSVIWRLRVEEYLQMMYHFPLVDVPVFSKEVDHFQDGCIASHLYRFPSSVLAIIDYASSAFAVSVLSQFGLFEAFPIAHFLAAIVDAIRLLIKVTEQVERFKLSWKTAI